MRKTFLPILLGLFPGSAPLLAVPPAAPTGVIAYAPNETSVHVSWEDQSADETGFQVERQVNGGAWTAVADLPANFLVHRGSAISSAPGTYLYRIRSYRGNEASAWVESPLLEKPSGPLDLLKDGSLEIPEGSGTRVGQAYSRQIPVFNGAPDRFVISRNPLPPGLSFDETTGVITKDSPYTAPDASKVHRFFVGVEFDGGQRFEQVHFLRVLPAPSTPEVAAPLEVPTLHFGTSGFLDIAQIFRDPARPLGAWFFTGGRSITVALHDKATPATVANFLGYVSRGDYDGTYIHRTIFDFIFQGGGYRRASDTAAPNQWAAVTKRAPVFNEPGLSNVPGTIAMAKLGGVRDSATSEWFFNVGAGNPANLDFQNGGFTAFGSIVGADGLDVADVITNRLVRNVEFVDSPYLIQVTGVGTGNFYNIPVLDPVEDPPGSGIFVPPATLSANSLLAVDAVAVVPPVSISLVSNSAPAVMDASVVGPLLYISGKGPAGTAKLTLRATNLDGNTVDYVLSLTIDDALTPGLRLLSIRGVHPPGTILVKAKATDTIGLGKWRYRINKKRWITGGRLSGTSAVFSKKIRGFRKGKNLIEFEVVDAKGNSSGVLKQTLTFR